MDGCILGDTVLGDGWIDNQNGHLTAVMESKCLVLFVVVFFFGMEAREPCLFG
jgi:hypothetical protein